MPTIHQVYHPGKELSISYRSRKRNAAHYFFFQDSKNTGIRFWNKCIVTKNQTATSESFSNMKGNS